MKLALLLVLLACCPLAGAQSALVNTSHSGPVNDLAYDAARDLLFSAGQDGTVRVWGVDGRLRASLRVSHRPLQRLALHPSLPQLAVLVGEVLKTDVLAVWDWELGRELFSRASDRQLLHLAYSPQGDFLAYSRADFRSLAAVDASSGADRGLLGTGFGIVSFFVISRNGNTIMGYQPSGWITYWDLRENRGLRQLRTLADLSLIRITASNRFLLAAAGDRLVAVDLLNGALAAGQPVPGLARLALSPDGEELAVDAAGALQRWRFAAGALTRSGPPAASEPALSALAYGAAGLYAGDRAGGISLVDAAGGRQSLARNLVLAIDDLAFRGELAAASTPEGIYLFRSSFLTQPLGAAAEASVSRLPPPFAGRTGVEFLDDSRLLAWQEEPGEVAVVDLASGSSRLLPIGISSSIQQLSLGPRGLILVERSGLCRILDPESLESRFRYTAGAMNRLVSTRGDFLVGAGAAGFGSPLFQINARTGETVPIPDPSLFVYDLLYSPSRTTLFSLSVEEAKGGSRTVLAARSGRQLEARRVLASFAGEDLGACLAEDPSGRLYSSLGFGPLTVWDGSALWDLANPGRVARRLAVHQGKLFAVNADGTLSIWETSARQEPWLMHLLLGGEWALQGPQGRTLASPGARQYLNGPW
jgi:WD40 repeat protein